MDFFKKSFFVLGFALLCIFMTYLTVNEYYYYLIIESGYLFGNIKSTIFPAIVLLVSSISLGVLIYDAYGIKGYKVVLIPLLLLLISFAYFMHSPLTKEDRVYKMALDHYGKMFNHISSDAVNNIHNHSEYIRYKYQLDNFEKDKSSRQAYKDFVNHQVERYYAYRKADGSDDINLFWYYVAGQQFNDFVLRYKGIENPQLQQELYEITKSGVVTYSDMMEFQTKFINDYKNSSKGD